MRAAIYARYSSENQRDTSIEDQVRVARKLIESRDWKLINVYADHAISGATQLRPGLQALLADLHQGKIDVVVAEALDRLSRDQEHVAGLFKQIAFAQAKIVTIAEGEINELHVGLKGTMNALFLKDLALKTHRGLEGRIRKGRSAGGLCFGYDVVRQLDERGEPARGERRINKTEAAIVQRIFEEFAVGKSPRNIAMTLNAEGIKGPSGTTWGPSTIYGNQNRGTGILNNELYVGRLVWNRQKFMKDPTTGKRIAFMNLASALVVMEVPELRIVDQKLWQRVKDRQTKSRSLLSDPILGNRPERARRPVYLFSGLLKCSRCDGGFSMVGAKHYGCSNARNRGTCDNKLTLRRDWLEDTVLDGLKTSLMKTELLTEFISEYHQEINRQRAGMDLERSRREKELAAIDKRIRALFDLATEGVRSHSLKDELVALDQRQSELKAFLANPPASPVRLHPKLAELYREKVEDLRKSLNREDARAEAVDILRSLIEEIRLVPENGKLRVHLKGQLAELLALAQNKRPGSKGTGPQVTLVAGTGFEPVTFRL